MEEPIITNTIADNVIRLRKARQWSVAKLARKADVSHAYIEKIEAGRTTTPSITHLQKVADALEVPLNDILTSDPDGTIAQAEKYQTEEEFIARMQAKYGDTEAFRMAVEVFRASLRLDEADQKMLATIVRRLAVDD
jgi:transcriptional regulator with XRE-family HTH domain